MPRATPWINIPKPLNFIVIMEMVTIGIIATRIVLRILTLVVILVVLVNPLKVGPTWSSLGLAL